MNSNDFCIFWNETINQLKEDKLISIQEFEMWFSKINCTASTNTTITISVPSNFYKDQITERYIELLENKLLEISGKDLIIHFEIIPKREITLPIKTDVGISPSTDVSTYQSHPQLKADFTFDNFVVGNNNLFAANAGKSISENPGSSYNPCLIYGSVGMGKTHLMQSIGNEIFTRNNGKRIVFISAETFVTDFVQSIRNKTQQAFKNKYRNNVDILLIDDIHEFQNKEGTQDELFHTFNSLYDANKQMVFTCDRPPSELVNFTKRLKSRFEMGLNVDIQPPNYETRLAILKNMNDKSKIHIPDEVIELICKNIITNVRDLKAAWTRLIGYADLVGKAVTLDIAQNQLRQVFNSPLQANITIDRVQKIVSDYFNMTPNDLKGKKKTKVITFPRQISMYIIREVTDFSTTKIGLEFGGRDHTTVIYSCQKIEDKMKNDPTIEPLVTNLIRSVRENDME